jgi:hypothetical protein
MLRKKLQEMTTTEASRQPALLAALSREYPNTIAVLDSLHSIGGYTCLMHVFDFAEKEEYEAIATHEGAEIYVGADFAHWLLNNGLLKEVSQGDVQRMRSIDLGVEAINTLL